MSDHANVAAVERLMRKSAVSLFEGSKLSRDTLSHLLRLMELKTVFAGGLHAGGDWSLSFASPQKVKFMMVGRGNCALQFQGTDTLVALTTGDIVLLNKSGPFTIGSQSALLANLSQQSASQVFEDKSQSMVTVGEGRELTIFGCHLDVEQSSYSDLFLSSLPAFSLIPASSPAAPKLKWLIESVLDEASDIRPGTELAMANIINMIFIHLLRDRLIFEPVNQPNLLKALSDNRLEKAIGLMHQQPEQAWTLAELAKAAAMSRTTFATRFKEAAGIAPLAYLTKLRMALAQRLLRQGKQSLEQVASAVGYGSEAAFSTAFKRLVGQSPAHWRRTGGGY